MGKGEIKQFDLVYNFSEKLKKHLELNKFSTENDILVHKEFLESLHTDMKTYLVTICSIASFQYEIGTKTFNHHLKMRIKLKVARTYSLKADKGIKKLLDFGPLKGCNISPTSKTCIDNNDWHYTTKEDTKVDKHYMLKSNSWSITDINGNSKKEKIIDFVPEKFNLNRIKLTSHQEDIINEAKLQTAISTDTWNDRSLNYCCDPGNQTKSTICGVLKFNDLGLNIIKLQCINDYKIIMQDLYQQVHSICERNNFMIVVDFPRCLNKLYSMYAALEESKEGCFYDPRYDRKEWTINCPSIWIFANTPPDTSLMTEDRWKFWTIEDDNLIKINKCEMKKMFIKYNYNIIKEKELEYNYNITECYNFINNEKCSWNDLKNIKIIAKLHNINFEDVIEYKDSINPDFVKPPSTVKELVDEIKIRILKKSEKTNGI